MGKLTDCYVELKTEDKLDTGLNAAKGKLEGFARDAAKFSAISLGVAAGAGIAGLAGFLSKSVEEASKLAETTNKVEVAFGGAAGVVTSWAQQMADKFGVVKSTTMDAVAGFGLMAQGMGMTKAESASFATTLGTVADDVTSLYNVPLPEVLEKIRSGLAGEAEPLRTFGVNLTAAAVEAHALEMGLASGKKELSDYALMVSRADLIIKGLSAAQGDHENTLDSLSNKQRKLTGDITNMQAAIGTALLDPTRDLIKAVYELGGALDGTFGGDRATQMKSLGGFFQSFVDSLRYLIAGNPLAGLEEGLLTISTSLFGNTFGDKDRLFDLQTDRARKLADVDKEAKKAQKASDAFEAKFHPPGWKPGDGAASPEAAKAAAEREQAKTAPEEAKKKAEDAKREAKKAQDHIAERIKHFEEKELTPREKIAATVNEAHEYALRGLISGDTYRNVLSHESGVDKALQDAQEKVLELQSPRNRQLTGAVYGDLLSANSAMMQQSLDGGIPQQQLEQAKKMVEQLTALREDIRNDKPGAYEQLQLVLKGRE